MFTVSGPKALASQLNNVIDDLGNFVIDGAGNQLVSL